MSVFLTIGILTANRDVLLGRLLNALKEQIDPKDEVIILDTARQQSTRRVVAGHPTPLFRYHVYTADIFDFATARNEIINLASRDSLVFIDDDAIPFPGWLDRVRRNLTIYDASGGPSIAAGPLPAVWDSEINWCIGLSPAGLIEERPGYYPNSSNLAARIDFIRKHDFQVLNKEGCLTREDAQWWMECRQRGDNVGLDFQQAVAHQVYGERLTRPYVCERAQKDGEADWTRSPSLDKALEIPITFVHQSFTSNKLAHKVLRNRAWGQLLSLWSSRRQFGLSRSWIFRRTLTGLRLRLRKSVSRYVSTSLHRLRTVKLPEFLPEVIFVSAECRLGDTVLLRRHIHNLALTFRGSRIVVSAKYPEVLTGLADNVVVFEGKNQERYLHEFSHEVSVAIVPYFHGGNEQVWNTYLSKKTVTFDKDVGFRRPKYYHLAQSLVKKNLELHEHENLCRLFSVWHLNAYVNPDPVRISDSCKKWWESWREGNGLSDPYMTIQLGAGYKSKEWPVEYWMTFLEAFCKRVCLPIVLIGDSDARIMAQEIISNVSPGVSIVAMTGQTTVEQLCAVVKHSHFFMGPCSGPGQIAFMYEIPSFSLYMATEPYRWGATENHDRHDYACSLKQKLTVPELQGQPEDFRSRILDPLMIAEQAANHFMTLKRQEKQTISAEPAE